MASAQDIVNAAYELLGVNYRNWQPDYRIPMWLDDGPYMDVFLNAGHQQGVTELRSHLQQVGVMGADLINFALVANRLYETGGGTGTYANYLVNTYDFDPSAPGQVGAIALRPYQNEQDNGSIALYVDPHYVIQSIPSEGVTDRYTDEETYSWASQGYPRYGFTIYGFLPGVSY